MSFHLSPILNNGKLNTLFNPSDFQYEYDNINYVQGDERYTKNTNYTSKMTSLDNSITTINNTIHNISYDSSTNKTNFTGDVDVSGNLQGLSNTIYGYLNTMSSNA